MSIKTIYLIAFIGFFGAIMLSLSSRHPMWMDEYIFYRLSSSLPNYSVSSDWLFKDRPSTINPTVDWGRMNLSKEEALGLAYNTPIYTHTPLIPVLVSPIVKGLNSIAYNSEEAILAEQEYEQTVLLVKQAYDNTDDKTQAAQVYKSAITSARQTYNEKTSSAWQNSSGIIPSIEEQPGVLPTFNTNGVSKAETQFHNEIYKEFQRTETMTMILRLVPIGLFTATLWLIFKISQRKVGTKYALFFAFPVASGTMMMLGSYLFYWDTFMMFFFVLTIYLMEAKPNSKWKYVTACALVNTKIFIGMIFLIPLIVKSLIKNKKGGWKMLLPMFSILPFYIVTVVTTGDMFYIFNHYLNQTPIHNFMYTLNTPLDWVKIILGLGMPFYLVMTVPIIKYWRKYPDLVIYFGITMLYAWGTGLGITHASSMLPAGALIFPLVAYEWKLIERIQKKFSKKKAEA